MDEEAMLAEAVETLRVVDLRVRELAEESSARVLAGSADRASMELMYAAIRGDVPAADGVAALRRGLRADGVDEDTIAHIEGLFLNAAMGI